MLNLNGRISGFNMDFNNSMQCVLQDGIIYHLDYYSGNKTPIGHSNDRFNELLDISNEYKQMCLDAGLIEPERTPEEIQADMQAMISNQNKMMLEMADIIQSLKGEVKELKDNEFTKPSDAGGKSLGSRRGASKSSNAKGDTLPKQGADETTGD